MIVRNEAHMRNDGHIIQNTLDSVAPYISSWVIVDTGSDDGTQDLIADHMARLGIPGKLYERPWRTCAAEEAVRRAPDSGRYVLADVVVSGPAMFDTTRLDQAGGVDGTDADPIAELRRAAAAGLQTASLDKVLCQGPSGQTATTHVEVIAPLASLPKKIHRFCVTHTEPLIPESWYDDCIALGNYQPDSVSHVSRLDQFWHEARPLAYGAARSYVLPIAIEKFADDADLIEISMYRKKILLSPMGRPGAHPKSRELNVEECREKTELLSVITPPSDSGFLLPQPIYVEEGLMGLYARYHPFRDLLDYTSLAIEMGVLDNQSAGEFFSGKLVIPGGTEFGIFPKSWLIPTLSQLERASRDFLCNYGNRIKEYDKIQVRAVGFLSECLGSFLLIRHLKERYSRQYSRRHIWIHDVRGRRGSALPGRCSRLSKQLVRSGALEIDQVQ